MPLKAPTCQRQIIGQLQRHRHRCVIADFHGTCKSYDSNLALGPKPSHHVDLMQRTIPAACHHKSRKQHLTCHPHPPTNTGQAFVSEPHTTRPFNHGRNISPPAQPLHCPCRPFFTSHAAHTAPFHSCITSKHPTGCSEYKSGMHFLVQEPEFLSYSAWWRPKMDKACVRSGHARDFTPNGRGTLEKTYGVQPITNGPARCHGVQHDRSHNAFPLALNYCSNSTHGTYKPKDSSNACGGNQKAKCCVPGRQSEHHCNGNITLPPHQAPEGAAQPHVQNVQPNAKLFQQRQQSRGCRPVRHAPTTTTPAAAHGKPNSTIDCAGAKPAAALGLTVA